MIKVLFLTTHLNIGGISLYIYNLCKAFKGMDIKPYVVSSGGDLEKEFHDIGIELNTIDLKTKFEFHPKIFFAIFKVVNFIKENDIDIIHANTRVTQILAAICSRLAGKKFVSTCHGYFNFKRYSRKLFSAWGDFVIAISRQVQRHLIDDFKINPDKIRVIHNGVDLKKFKVSSADRVKQLKDKLRLPTFPVIGSIGRFSPVKGFDKLIGAMRHVVKDFPNAQLILIGEGPDKEKLERLCAEERLENNVIFIPATINTAEYFMLMDVFIFPSRQEGLGLSLIEAMANGRVCIASDAGGIKDVIDDGVSGIIVKDYKSSAFAKAIVVVLKNETLRQKIAEQAKIKAENSFSIEETADKTAAFYKEVLNKT